MNRFSRLVALWPLPLKRPDSFRWPSLGNLRRFRQRPRAEGDGPGLAQEQPSPLFWALLAAVALHGLALSYRSLSLQRQPPPLPAPIADDSPELLQFSRRQPLEQALQTVPIAPLNSLPLLGNLPPPPASLPPNPATPARLGSGTAGLASRPRQASQEWSQGIAASRQQPAGSGGRDNRSNSDLSPAVVDSVLVWIHRLQGRGEAAEPRPTAELEPSLPLEPQRPEGEAAVAWRRLWKRAAAVPITASPQALVQASIELRRLPLAAAALAAGNRNAPTALLLDGRLLLLWPEGSVLWLLRAPPGPGVQPGDGTAATSLGAVQSR